VGKIYIYIYIYIYIFNLQFHEDFGRGSEWPEEVVYIYIYIYSDCNSKVVVCQLKYPLWQWYRDGRTVQTIGG